MWKALLFVKIVLLNKILPLQKEEKMNPTFIYLAYTFVLIFQPIIQCRFLVRKQRAPGKEHLGLDNDSLSAMHRNSFISTYPTLLSNETHTHAQLRALVGPGQGKMSSCPKPHLLSGHRLSKMLAPPSQERTLLKGTIVIQSFFRNQDLNQEPATQMLWPYRATQKFLKE